MGFSGLSFSDLTYLVRAAVSTWWISCAVMGSAIVIGSILGIVRAIKVPILSQLTAMYVWVFRGTPLLVQLFLVFFAVPSVLGIQIPALPAAFVALLLYATAFLIEIVRGAVESVGQGQWDAAKSLGMNTRHQLQHVILPQSTRVMLAPGLNLFVGLIKDSSLISVIGCFELTRAGTIIASRLWGGAMGIYAIVAVLYFGICYPLAVLGRSLEKRVAKAQ